MTGTDLPNPNGPLASRLLGGRPAVEAASRACITLLLPMLVLFATDRLDLGLYVSFAAFTGLYGRGEPYRSRAISVAVGGIALVLSIGAGIAVQLAGAPWWLVVAGFVPVVAIGTPLAAVFQLVPRGAVFFAFAYLVCAVHGIDPATAVDAVVVAVAVVVFSWLVAMAGSLFRLAAPIDERLQPLTRVPVRRASRAWSRDTVWLVVLTLAGAGLAGALATWLGIAEHHYWAVVTVVAILSGPNALTSYVRGRHRVVGTLVGVGLAAALFGGGVPPIYIIIVMAVCSFITEIVITRHYGSALAFITPMAIGAANLTGAQAWESLFVDRARETLIGGVVCLLIVAVVRAVLRRRGELEGQEPARP